MRKPIISIGSQDFAAIRKERAFYIDKTGLIKEWWENKDIVTLITRPRRFGKTLNMSMMECFFSQQYKGRNALFEGLSIWKEEKFRSLQGRYPVLALSFADVKASSMESAREGITAVIREAYKTHAYLLQGTVLDETEKQTYYTFGQQMRADDISSDKLTDTTLTRALKLLMSYMERYFGQKVLVFLDEYDTPLQEAYIHGYWKELAEFIRSLFNSTFKTNRYLERALLTGITRISKESIFSDVNNIEVVTTTSEKYCTSFGFTESEVEDALKEFGLKETLPKVRQWYDGFCFGSQKNIYNPWSITKYLDSGKFDTYWANTSSNSLIGKLIREGAVEVKTAVEDLLQSKTVETVLDEEIIFNQLEDSSEAVWSLFLASGYLTAKEIVRMDNEQETVYHLMLTNLEVKKEFRRMIQGWFKRPSSRYNDFIRALLENNINYMNQYMNHMASVMFSFFDSGNKPSNQSEPERFYHGFVLGLIADAKLDYVVTSNRESGLGRYDVIMEPKDKAADAYIFEFKVKSSEEGSLNETVWQALQQIEEKNYDAGLLDRGIPKEHIRHYGFAFEGKNVLIGTGGKNGTFTDCCGYAE